MTRIGVLSDTHAYLDERIFEHFKECDEIWHAGDIGSAEVIQKLAAFVAEQTNTDVALTKRAAYLCKADLLTNMVYH